MKVNVSPINVTIDGPETGYLNVYKRTVNGEIFYTTGRKSYATVDLAILRRRAPSDWEHVGTIPVEYYRNHVNANMLAYNDALKGHIIHDIDSFLSRETRQIPPTSKKIKVKTGVEPVTEMQPVRKPSKAKKPVKASKGATKAKKPVKKPGKPTVKPKVKPKIKAKSIG